MNNNNSLKKSYLISVLLWCAIIGIITYAFVKEEKADVFLDVYNESRLISGSVLFNGVPLNTGTVHVAVSDAKTGNPIFGESLQIDQNGLFKVCEPKIFGDDKRLPSLQINVEYHGRKNFPRWFSEKTKSKPVSGEATVYLNWPSPPAKIWRWTAGFLVLAFFILQFFLFTGNNMGRLKARWLFILMYMLTFLSLVLPIGLSVMMANYPNIGYTMEKSPIGIIKAKTKVFEDPQWLVNIGGTVRAVKIDTTSPEQPKPTPDTMPQSTPAGGQMNKKTQSLTPPPEPPSKNEPAASSGPDGVNEIVGGLVVPFYVVILAMLGAGINMTLKVPEIQKTADMGDFPKTTGSGFLRAIILFKLNELDETSPAEREKAATVRLELIKNYMYLLSAPFLAIAMYYLLRIVAQQVTEPILVVMSFATGLASRGVIISIIKVAEKKLPDLVGEDEAPAPQAKADDISSVVDVAQKAKVKVDKAKKNLKRAEDEFNELCNKKQADANDSSIGEALEAAGKQLDEAKDNVKKVEDEFNELTEKAEKMINKSNAQNDEYLKMLTKANEVIAGVQEVESLPNKTVSKTEIIQEERTDVKEPAPQNTRVDDKQGVSPENENIGKQEVTEADEKSVIPEAPQKGTSDKK